MGWLLLADRPLCLLTRLSTEFAALPQPFYPLCCSAVPCLFTRLSQVCAFLDKLGELRSLQPLAASMCRKMNELYDLDSSQNYEVRHPPPKGQPQAPELSAH